MKQFRGFKHIIGKDVVELRTHSLPTMDHWISILSTIILNFDTYYKDNFIHVQLEQNDIDGFDSVLKVSYYSDHYNNIVSFTYVHSENFSDYIIDTYVVPIMEHNGEWK